ncbi:uncharacterized protein BO97DRAFT_185264 [Aspergillus homomorphus CBS 101889]|uniref:Uncharacterized protein n=1 Tax=Aspergillus homomorphus (strain CBS 101889) TaxID=1450537 RepID=A0A395HNF1_ASPHC|nr:hypothetical protein BO97DRAFT_185264 [Aspergillus homomorphus CBS 101889]RAL09146.1 hypothetical protein BO97DRAFT_185264 [Aspergillus homomorphus CBS 101889]
MTDSCQRVEHHQPSFCWQLLRTGWSIGETMRLLTCSILWTNWVQRGQQRMQHRFVHIVFDVIDGSCVLLLPFPSSNPARFISDLEPLFLCWGTKCTPHRTRKDGTMRHSRESPSLASSGGDGMGCPTRRIELLLGVSHVCKRGIDAELAW